MLDLETKALLKNIEENAAVDFADLPPKDSRFLFSVMAKNSGLPRADVEVQDLAVPGPGGDVPIRYYRPRNVGEPLPVLLFFHGGGFVIGSVDDYDGCTSTIAEQSGCAVVSVDYRLAPEHPYPAAVEDCYAVLQWIAENGAELGLDTNRLAVGGDSAGGNLAAVCAQLARDNQGPAIAYQVLIYPATSADIEGSESYRAFGEGFFLTSRTMSYFIGHYIGAADPGSIDHRMTPLSADSLANLPPALILVAGFDPLRDDGIAYAHKMLEHGSQATLMNYCGTIHGFLSLAGQLQVGKEAIAHIASNLKQVLLGK